MNLSRGFAFVVVFLLVIVSNVFSAPAKYAVDVFDGIAYFLQENPARIQRYNLNEKTWMEPVVLPENASAIGFDADSVYVALGKSVYRYAHDFTGATFLRSVDSNPHELYIDGDVLIINYSGGNYGNLATVNRNTGVLIGDISSTYRAPRGSSHAPSLNKIFGTTSGISPADITMVDYTDAGNLGSVIQSPYHGDFNIGSRVWVFPKETKVVCSAGIIYSTIDLTYLGSLGTPFDSIAFNGDLPITLNGTTITAYNQALLPTGTISLEASATQILVHNGEVFAFHEPASGVGSIEVSVVSLSEIKAPNPNEPIDPHGLAYTPEAIFRSGEDLLMIDRETGMLFYWSNVVGHYVAAVPFRGNPTHMAYHEGTGRLFLAYADRMVTKIDVGDWGQWPEEPIAIGAANIGGLSIAGDLLVIQDASGSWATHRTYSLDGVALSSKDSNYLSPTSEWNPYNHRLYYFRSSSPSDLISAPIASDGTIGALLDSPYHTSSRWIPPIRVFDNGTKILLGTGAIYSAETLSQINTLPNAIVDACWHDGRLFSIYRSEVSNTKMTYTLVQRWADNYGPDGASLLPGEPLRLVSAGNRIFVVSLSDGIPQVSELDTELNLIWTTIVEQSPLKVTNVYTDRATLSWDGTNLTGVDATIERFHLMNGQWEEVGHADAGSGSFTLVGLLQGENYMYRVRLASRFVYEELAESTQRSVVQLILPYTDYNEVQRYRYEILDNDVWKSINYTGLSSSGGTLRVSFDKDLEPFTKVNLRAQFDDFEYSDTPINPAVNFTLYVNWLRASLGNYPFNIYEYTGAAINPYKLIEVVEPEVFSRTYTGDSAEDFPYVHVFSDTPGTDDDESVFMQLTYRATLSWDPLPGAIGYRIGESYGSLISEEASFTYQNAVTFSAGDSGYNGFYVPPVLAVLGNTVITPSSEVQVYTTLQRPSGSYGTMYLQYRTDPGGSWHDAGSASSYSPSHIISSSIIPEYRLAIRKQIPSSEIGTQVFKTLEIDNLDALPGSVATDAHGNRFAPWFGHYHFNASTPDYVFSYDYGWCYLSALDANQLWIWTERIGWTFWNASQPNVLYVAGRDTWFFHWQGSGWHYNYGTGLTEHL